MIRVLLLLALLVGASPLSAQPSAPADQAAPDPAAVEALIRSLEDPEQRAQLIGQLRLLMAAKPAPAPTVLPDEVAGRFLSAVSNAVAAGSVQISRAVDAFGNLPALWHWAAYTATDPFSRQRLLSILGSITLVIGAALAAAWLVRHAAARPLAAVEGAPHDTLGLRLLHMVERAGLLLLPVAAFLAVGYGTLTALNAEVVTRLSALVLINAGAIGQLVLLLARMVLAPDVPALRPLPLADETANYLYLWVRRFTAVVVFGQFGAESALLVGVPLAAHGLILKLVYLTLTAMAVVFILQVRQPVSDVLRGRAGREDMPGLAVLRQRVADIWYLLAILYAAALYVVWALEVDGGFEYIALSTLASGLVLLLLGLARGGIRTLIGHGFSLPAELKRTYPGLEARANRYLPLLYRGLDLAVIVLSVFMLLEAWSIDSLGWFVTVFGQRAISSLITIALILLLSVALWEAVSALIEGQLRRLDRDGVSSRRARTLLPLFRRAISIVLVVMVGLIVLSEIGINIAPLLAGAGVVGLAVGFGAQTLVKDVITGLFMLVEDTINVGDVVQLAGRAGVVESISVRTIRLRDQTGSVHTIPFSAVDTIQNMTKDFSFAVLDIGVDYREDVDEVCRVLRAVDESLRAEDEFRHAILAPLEVLGIEQFQDSAVVIRIRSKTLPGSHWRVGREFRRRVKMRFDAEGISIPFPQRTIHLVQGGPAAAPPPSPPPSGAAERQ